MSEPRPFQTPAAAHLLGLLGGTEWDPEHNYESPTARMIREVEEQAAEPGAALAEELCEIWALADAREPLAAIEARARAAITTYERSRQVQRAQED